VAVEELVAVEVDTADRVAELVVVALPVACARK